MNSIHKPQGTTADYASGKISDKKFVFELLNRNPENGIVRSKETGRTIAFPISKSIPLIGTIYWKDKEGVVYTRAIRYIKGESSIFVDEQKPDNKDNPPKKVYWNFLKGRKEIDGSNSVLLKFVMNWDMNQSKDAKYGRFSKDAPEFKLVDNTKSANKAKEADELEYDVVKWCREADWKTKVQPLASLIFSAEQMMQNSDEIRYNLVQVAKRDPAQFKVMLDDPKTERAILLKAAIERGIVIIRNDALYWRDNNNEPISVAAQGQDVVKDYVSKSFSGRGEEIYSAIKRIMNPPAEAIVKEIAPQTNQTVPPKVDGVDSDEVLMGLIKEGIEREIIPKRGIWYKYKDFPFQKKEKLLQELKDVPALLAFLKSDLTKPSE